MKQIRLPIVAIVGRPNVGKSTLFNRLVGKRIAIESQTPGTTRDRLYDQVNWGKYSFVITDTAGISDFKKSTVDQLSETVKDSVYEAIEEADLILFMVDFTEKDNQLDKEVAAMLRRSRKKVIMLVNKCDNLERFKQLAEFERFGNWPILGVSATQKKNLGEVLDIIIDNLKKSFELKPLEKENDYLKLAIIGRPNVGKSTLFNSFSVNKKMIVSSLPGTTRDSQDEVINFKGQKIQLIDTAGMVRSGKTGQGIEKFSLIRTLQSVNNADIVVVLMDANEGITNLDRKIAGFATEGGKGIILALNKIDQLEDKEKRVEELIWDAKNDFEYIPYAPLVFISAENQENTKILLKKALEISNELKKEIPASELEELKHLLMKSFGQLPEMTSIMQEGVNPPVFVIRSKGRKRWHFSYNRFIENRLRDNFSFAGTPIKIVIKDKQKRS